MALYGAPMFGLVWVAAGVGGAAIDTYWPEINEHAIRHGIIHKPIGVQSREKVSIGASGSICGLAGIIACIFPPARLQMLGFAGFSIICVATDTLPNLGHVDHLAGMAIGATMWLVLLRRLGPRRL